MIDAMKFWVEEVGVDGFRCDAVNFVPQDFWKEAAAALKAAKPDIFLLAEGDGKQWHDAGFDMTYGWGLYGFESGVLKRIADGINTASHLSSYAESEKATYTGSAYRMYFTSNHDENSWYGTPAELFGEAAEAFAVLTATFNGMPLIYSGQEAGLDKRLRFFDKDQIIWRDHENANLYATLLHLKKENQALWNGDRGGLLQRVLTTDNVNIYAFVREKDEDKVFVALNLSPQQRSVTLSGTSFVDTYRNVFTGETVALEEQAILTLPAWGYVVYDGNEMNTSVDEASLPGALTLSRNYPNPFNASTTISYSLAAPSEVRLAVFDLLGREIRTLATGTKPAGRHEISFTLPDLPSGVYLYRLQVGNQRETKRLILLR
jgi:glycosidase